MKLHFVATLAIIALSNSSSLAEMQAKNNTSAHPKSLVGCWSRRIKEPDERNRWPNDVMYCLQSSGKLAGNAFDAGDGWDFGGRWRIQTNKLVIEIEERKESCSFSISAERDLLTITGCDIAGIYKFKKDLDADTTW